MSIDPAVQIRIIDLAWEWVCKTERPMLSAAEVMIKRLGEDFNRAYNIITDTVCSEPDKASGENKK